VVDVEVVVVGREITPTHDRVLVYAPRYPRVSYGDQVRITGVLREPEPIVQNDERVFLFQEYLKKDNIHFQISYPELEVRAHKRTSSLRGVLFEIKETFLSALRSVMSEPYVSLLGGLVVGAKESLGTELLDRFRAVGIVHIVVLSGYNVAVIARVVMNALAPLPRVLGWGIGSIFILLFTIMTGGSATIVRASIMTLLVFIAEAAGRKFDALRALIVAVLCMVIQNPRILAFDPSFQLSFLATFGLVTLSPYMEHLLRWVPIRFGIRNILAATLSTELAVLPLLLWMTGIFSVVAPIVNVLVLPTVPLAMFGGFVTGVVALVSTTLALPFSIITYALLAYQLFVVNLFSDLPFVALHLPHVSVTVMFVVYGFLFILFRKQFFQRKKE
jgi:competence protein ComEC